MGSNELGWVRLEVDVLLSVRMARPLAAAERARLVILLRRECDMLGFDDATGSDGSLSQTSGES